MADADNKVNPQDYDRDIPGCPELGKRERMPYDYSEAQLESQTHHVRENPHEGEPKMEGKAKEHGEGQQQGGAGCGKPGCKCQHCTCGPSCKCGQ